MAISEERRAELEGMGFVETTVQQFLGLSDIEMQIVEIRRKLAREVRERRKAAKMSQETLAGRLNVAQPRIPEIETGASVDLETLISAFFATGGTRSELGAVLASVA